MAKENARSLRLDSSIVEMIEAQAGENFTQKFESLVIRCMFELPETELRLEQLKQEIHEKQQELTKLSIIANAYASTLRNMANNIESLSSIIAKAQDIATQNM